MQGLQPKSLWLQSLYIVHYAHRVLWTCMENSYTLIRKGMRNFAIIILAIYQRNDCYYVGYLRAIFSWQRLWWKWKGSNSDEEVNEQKEVMRRMSTCEIQGLLFLFFVFCWVCRISSLTRHQTQASLVEAWSPNNWTIMEFLFFLSVLVVLKWQQS